ncbi:MAG TPA: hypothetical protein VEA80_15455 [Vitreimonas sp.]|uniref:hypothetical protein n=1 Tax=Vitreimonas sp. TaxID=3069702 RepID=UPI002D27CEAB|nr:hypothetical protein [Vitreimonas sp.]HYD88870.1 hypothetical protein [Vitreimonas sp.]
MHNEEDRTSDHDGGYYILPEAALQFLPPEWRLHFEKIAEDGRAVLHSVDKELSQLVRLTNSVPALAALKHAQRRLSEHKFAAEMDALLELDMLTTAFVVTYVRLHQGGSSGGFARDSLPVNLRSVHDEVIEFRNKRFAHNTGHSSTSNAMEVALHNDRFEVGFTLSLGYYAGGAKGWSELVDFLHELFYDRLQKVLGRLKEKTGRDWIFPTAPAPD